MKSKLIGAFAVIAVASAFFFERVPQDITYHQFADTRTVFGTANFWNVISNLPFVAVGIAGLWFLRKREHGGINSRLYPAYIVFFVGVLATGIGSGWYHLSPGNSTLVWDRLPMTIAFMGLFVVVIGEYVCDTSARRLLIPLLLIGAASVFYWQYTESTGAGDLRPYALVQFLPLIVIPVILIAYRSSFDMQVIYWAMIALYALSKLFELFDNSVYEIGNLLSGHSIKHLVAASAALLFLYALRYRRRLPATD